MVATNYYLVRSNHYLIVTSDYLVVTIDHLAVTIDYLAVATVCLCFVFALLLVDLLNAFPVRDVLLAVPTFSGA